VLEMPEVIRCALFRILLEAVDGRLCSLKAPEVSLVLVVPEAMHCVEAVVSRASLLIRKREMREGRISCGKG